MNPLQENKTTISQQHSGISINLRRKLNGMHWAIGKPHFLPFHWIVMQSNVADAIHARESPILTHWRLIPWSFLIIASLWPLLIWQYCDSDYGLSIKLKLKLIFQVKQIMIWIQKILSSLILQSINISNKNISWSWQFLVLLFLPDIPFPFAQSLLLNFN